MYCVRDPSMAYVPSTLSDHNRVCTPANAAGLEGAVSTPQSAGARMNGRKRRGDDLEGNETSSMPQLPSPPNLIAACTCKQL